MKGKTRLAILLVLAVQVVAILIYGGMVVAATVNQVDGHADITDVTNSTCIGCHTNKRLERSKGGATAAKNRILTAHRRHLVSGFFKFQCRTCHTSANLNNGKLRNVLVSGQVARKQVDPALCQRCHGAFNTAASPDHPTATKRSCQYCHNASNEHNYGSIRPVGHSKAGQARNSYLLETPTDNDGTYIGGINLTRANNGKYCQKCHGAIKLFQAYESNPDS